MVQPARPSLRSSTRDAHTHPNSQSTKNDASAPNFALRSSARMNKTLHDTRLHPNASVVNTTKPKPLHSLPDRTAQELRHSATLETKKSSMIQSRKRRLDETDKNPSNITNGVRPPPSWEQKERTRLTVPQQPQTNGTADQRKSASEDTRSLRSKAGGSRLKSDLAIYFSNFDDIISGVPQAPDYVKPDESIYIVNESLKDPKSISIPIKNASQSRFKSVQSSTSRNQYETIDLASLAPISIGTPGQDPLDDSVYLKAHRRSERREKQLRNIEKERAQHEKGQLESLLESLQGPDWLRAMGVTGITDGARKEWEPKRDYFIREVRALLRKFALWRDAEKRLLQEKENVMHAKEEDEEEEEEEEEDAEAIVVDYEDDDSSLNGPASSDVDAWAAHQLLQEAKSASQFRISKPRPPPKPPKPPGPPKPFVSFFSKPHERAAALGKGRQSSRRTSLAFGHIIPETSDVEFKLPKEYVTPEALMAHARKRRRLNRERKDDDTD